MLVVAYGVAHIDLDWVPPDVDVVVVHNDDNLSPASITHPGVRHLHPARNVGFGAGMNLALGCVSSERVILCNPDTHLEAAHFEMLDEADPSTIVAIPLVDERGTPNAVVSPYWSIPAFAATAWRLGRFAPKDSRRRQFFSRLLGTAGSAHLEALAQKPGRWSLTERWVSGAVCSLPTAAMRAVGGFDEDYFLYFEDADLQQRLGRLDPALSVELKDVPPARHTVGGSASQAERRAILRHRRGSARIYASRQVGIGWRVMEALLPRNAHSRC